MQCIYLCVCVCVVCIKAMYEGTGDETTLLSRWTPGYNKLDGFIAQANIFGTITV